MADEIVYEFKKNKREIVRVMLQDFNGQCLINLRVYVPRKDTGEPIPTRKGLALPIGLIAELKQSVVLLARAVQKRATSGGEPGGEA